ncbi:MAG: PH domain-containing protein [Candidatus Nanohalobium sp.]
MFSDVDELLMESETLQEKAYPSIKDTTFIGSYLIAGVMTVAVLALAASPSIMGLSFPGYWFLGLLIIPLAFFIRVEVKRRFIEYFITDQKVIERRGLLSQTTESTMYENITDVRLNESLLERIFDVGDIKVNTAGHDGATIKLKGVKNPERVKTMIESNINSRESGGVGGGLGSDSGSSGSDFDDDLDFDSDFDSDLEF